MTVDFMPEVLELYLYTWGKKMVMMINYFALGPTPTPSDLSWFRVCLTVWGWR